MSKSTNYAYIPNFILSLCLFTNQTKVAKRNKSDLYQINIPIDTISNLKLLSFNTKLGGLCMI